MAPHQRFCAMCGAAGGPARPVREFRKNVAVLFADVVDSTVLGERLDPESLRQVMQRYFAVCSACVAEHGGTVEKFIGDAVMAVFGVPFTHEDDGLRAVHAAAAMMAAVAELSADLALTHHVRLELRVGVCAGEVVVTGSTSTDLRVVGDVVNTASRLQSAAGPGEILLSGHLARAVRAYLRLEPVPALRLKGKSKAVPAWRLASLEPPFAAEGPQAAPLIGRGQELRQLQQAHQRAVTASGCCLVTVLGAPGIGKSRLVQEFLDSTGDRAGKVLVGHCRSYGRGATYSPLLEMLGAFPGGWPAIALALQREGDGSRALRCLAALAGATGASPERAGVAEICWATRRLLEAAARDGPLTVVWEDLHWAEPTLLDLIDDVATWMTGSSALMICVGRPELLDNRPAWGKARPGAFALDLPPLTSQQSMELVAALTERGEVSAQQHTPVLDRVATACEGNPLFAELMLEIVTETGGDARIPATISTLLAARLDQLPLDERELLERAATAGREFRMQHLEILAAGEETAGEDPGVQIRALLCRRLLQPSGSAAGFRFTQALVRDTAYQMTPKSLRERWHLRLADWLSAAAQPDGGQPAPADDGILAYHLEASYLLGRDLRPGDPALPERAARAAQAIAGQGELAQRRGDLPAAAALLRRAQELLPAGDPRHRTLALRLCDARLGLWQAEAARDALTAAEHALSGDRRCRMMCDIQRCVLLVRSGAASPAAVSATASGIGSRLAGDQEDHLSWCRFHQLQAFAWISRDQIGAAEAALAEALTRARRIGDTYEEERILSGICELALWGPAPVPAGLALCEELTGRFAGSRASLVPVLGTQAALTALGGDFAAARSLLGICLRDIGELHLNLSATVITQIAGLIDALAGDHDAAASHFSRGSAELARAGQARGARMLTAYAAREAFAAGHTRAAASELRALGEGEEDPDLRTRLVAATVRAQVAGAEGRGDAALHAARQAVRLAGATDDLCLRGMVLRDVATVLARLGRATEARAAAAEALRNFTAKGAAVLAESMRAWPGSGTGPEPGAGAVGRGDGT